MLTSFTRFDLHCWQGRLSVCGCQISILKFLRYFILIFLFPLFISSVLTVSITVWMEPHGVLCIPSWGLGIRVYGRHDDQNRLHSSPNRWISGSFLSCLLWERQHDCYKIYSFNQTPTGFKWPKKHLHFHSDTISDNVYTVYWTKKINSLRELFESGTNCSWKESEVFPSLHLHNPVSCKPNKLH